MRGRAPRPSVTSATAPAGPRAEHSHVRILGPRVEITPRPAPMQRVGAGAGTGAR